MYQKTQISAKSKIFNWLQKTEKGITKKRLQKVQNPEKLKICMFFAYNFFPEHDLSPVRCIWNQPTILLFLILHTDFVGKNVLGPY
jgi:hypothetical protein